MKGLLKLYGIERTCTNYVKALLEQNLRTHVFSNMFGLKHEAFVSVDEFSGPIFKDGRVATDIPIEHAEALRERAKKEGLQYVVLIKNPHAWIVSYHKYRNALDRSPNRKIDVEMIEEYCARWNDVYANWYDSLVSDPDHDTIVVSYERLLEDFVGEVERVRVAFGLEAKQGTFTDIKYHTHMGGDWTTESGKNITGMLFGNRDYYLKKQYLDKMNDRQTACVDQNLDMDLYRRLYEAATQ